MIDGSGHLVRQFPVPIRTRTRHELLLELVTDRVSASIQTVVVDRATLIGMGGMQENREIREDLDLELRLAQRFEAAPIPDIVLQVRDHPGRTTRFDRDPSLRSANVLRALLERNPPDPVRRAARRILAGHLTASAKLDLVHGARTEARTKLRECAWPGMGRPRWWWLAGRAWLTG